MVGQIENYKNYISKLTLRDDKKEELGEQEIREHIVHNLNVEKFHLDVNQLRDPPMFEKNKLST